MVELSLGDLLRWKPDIVLLAGSSAEQDAALDREISWAVSIRATTPVLPPLRGGELVIVPESILEELADRESIGWSELVSHLHSLPVSAMITDHPAAADDGEGIVVFKARSTLSPDLELELNREFTERRSSLYQLGSDLARLFSSASIGGLDLNGFLELAGRRTGIPVVLMTATGRVLAMSADELNPTSAAVADDAIGRRVYGEGMDWISQEVRGIGLPGGVYLVASIPPDEPGDRARLVLEQTGEALGLIFDRLPPVESAAPRDEAGQILSDLVATGSLPSAARRRLTQLASGINLSGRLRVVVEPDRGTAGPVTTNPTFESGEVRMSLISQERYTRITDSLDGSMIISRPFQGIDELPGAVEPVLKAHRLQSAGLFPAGPIDFGEPGAGGSLGALLLLCSMDRETLRHLGEFADAMLGDLEAYDRSRDARLVETLDAFLDAGATVATASERLGVHRNTLSYRIARIAEVGGHDLTDASVRFDLQLAIAIRRLQSA